MLPFRYRIYLAFILFVAFVVFTSLVMRGFLLSVDHSVNQTIYTLTNDYSPLSIFNFPIYYISRALAFLYIPLILIIFLLFMKFLRTGLRFEAVTALTSFSGGILSEIVLKPIYHVQCPLGSFSLVLADQEALGLLFILRKVNIGLTCYPSTHVTAYVVFCGYLAYLVLKYIKKALIRFVLLSILIGIIILVGPSRLYLHAHWFSDVAAGYLLGFALLLVIFSFQYLYEKANRKR